ncbi:MAG: hypothetical protein ABIQ44_05270 [Chloroflexia bacterium]
MPKKTTTTAQQRARQEQWRRRVDAQMGGGAVTRSMTEIADDAGTTMDGSDGYQQAEMRQMPASVSTSAAAGRTATRVGGAAMPTAGQRRALAATRATRARIASTTISLDEEMHFVKADIRKLITLTVACLAIIIVLAIVINNFL